MANYNGYTNRETWNLSLWIHNDYAMYSDCIAPLIKSVEAEKPLPTAFEIAEGICDKFMKGIYHCDFDKSYADSINYIEIADVILEDL